MKSILLAAALLIVTTACTEKPQTAGGIKGDAAPFTGTGKPYAESNWKQGDRKSWESALKVRTQNGQNDYTKTP